MTVVQLLKQLKSGEQLSIRILKYVLT